MAANIQFDQVSYTYQAGSPEAHEALSDVSLTISADSYTAIIGHTGSGKSTLIQHINALLKPTNGTVTVGDFTIDNQTTNKNLRPLRKQVGMVFQFPEKQLFEETVIKDIMFGPKNYGASDEEALQAGLRAMDLVGLPQKYQDTAPLDLSGGQMRRVAIAGVLAMQPEILILDEPTAGLDPRGHDEIMQLVQQLHEQQHMTIVLVTHQMDDVIQAADQVVVMSAGTVQKVGTPAQIFSDEKWVKQMQLTLPTSTAFAAKLKAAGFPLMDVPLGLDQLTMAITQTIRGNSHE